MMRKKRVVPLILTFSLLSGIVFVQLNQKESVSANSINYESLAKYVKNYKSVQSKKSSNIINEKKFAEQYFFKKYLTSVRLSDSEAKKLAFEKVIEEKALIEKAKNENLLALEVEAKKMSDDVRNLLINEPEENKEVIDNVKDVINGLGITEDEYYNEFLMESYITSISIDNLFNKVTEGYNEAAKEQIWDEFKTSEKSKFIAENKESINEFLIVHAIN
ncbi:hypothetical protein ACIQ6U_02595 [Lysinibacillus fusiformis]|uniref:hypothetical protein n=1 Tax=Lysinibacillus fusiformis TaxID=28031 RepID=UPI0038200056